MSSPSHVVQVQGQGAVSADQLNTDVQYATTFADLRTFIGVDQMTCICLGGASINDGLQGIFYWNSGVTTDDGVNNILPSGSSSGGWTRVTPKQTVAAAPGFTLNIRASQTAAAATLAFTADQVIVGTALNGTPYVLPSYSQTLNVAATGAGGMDTGSAPTSGFVAVYAIYNPTTATTSILGTNASTSSGVIYSGANLPSGYTASCLIGTWPTDSSGNLVAGYQLGREMTIAPVIVLNTQAAHASTTSLSISAAAPPNAKYVFGELRNISGNSGLSTGVQSMTVGSDTNLVGGVVWSHYEDTTQLKPYSVGFGPVAMATAQTLFYQNTVNGTVGMSSQIRITGYTIP